MSYTTVPDVLVSVTDQNQTEVVVSKDGKKHTKRKRSKNIPNVTWKNAPHRQMMKRDSTTSKASSPAVTSPSVTWVTSPFSTSTSSPSLGSRNVQSPMMVSSATNTTYASLSPEEVATQNKGTDFQNESTNVSNQYGKNIQRGLVKNVIASNMPTFLIRRKSNWNLKIVL